MSAINLSSPNNNAASALGDLRSLLLLKLYDGLWAAGVRESRLCRSGYKAARGLSRPVDAEKWIDRGLAVPAPLWQLARAKGDLHRQRGEWADAQRRYRQAIAIAPRQAIPHALLARSLINSGEFSEAAGHLKRALEITDKPQWHVTLARTLMRSREFGEAATHLRHALSITDDAQWHVILANCELGLGNLQEAREEVKRAYQLDPKPNVAAMIADLDRRLAPDASGSGEATAGFYDDVYAESERYQDPWRASVYANVWEAIAGLLARRNVQAIFDLGCGPGQFAGCVAELLPHVKYHGVDFSQVAITRGQKLFPSFKFSELALPVASYEKFEPFDAVVCTEVLEHIETDTEVLAPVKPNTFIVFSVPNFQSFGHVRIFASADDVRARYGQFFNELSVEPQELGAGNILWLASGYRI